MELIFSLENIVIVEEGWFIILMCWFNEISGIYSFFYIDIYGNRINYGKVGGVFFLCMSFIN